MKQFLLLMFAVMPIGGMMAQDTQNAEMNRFIDNLMNKMTIEEKIGQLNMPNIDGAVITGPVKNTNTGERLRKNEVGALLNLQDVKKIREVQQLALDHSRFKIPLLFGMDVIHGYKTIFYSSGSGCYLEYGYD